MRRDGHRNDLTKFYNTLKKIPDFQLILIDIAKGGKNLNIFNLIDEYQKKNKPKTEQVKLAIQQKRTSTKDIEKNSTGILSKTLKTIESIINEVTKLKMKDKTETQNVLDEITRIIEKNERMQKP